ncbi:MAG: RNA polymerase sigma factor [Acidobacteria bacterium]|nr:RNA polymerase sigma factor [Acidobacteriota bacterium]
MTPTDDFASEGRVSTGDTPEVRALVAAAREGDRAAFDQIVSIHYRAAFRMALAALKRREDAEDAFVLAWREVSHFRSDSSFKTWLLTIVWRQALDRRKSRTRWWQRSSSLRHDDHGGDDEVDRLASHEADPERRAEARRDIACGRCDRPSKASRRSCATRCCSPPRVNTVTTKSPPSSACRWAL